MSPPQRRDEPFPSAGCASAREETEATGDPFAPPVRLSAPTGLGRPARTSLRSVYVGLRPRSGPLREASAPPDETASRGTHGRSRGQGARGKRRAEPRRVFRGPTGRATRRFTSAVSGGSERRAPGSPRGWPVGGRPRKTSERTAARRAPFLRTDCRAERGETRPLGFNFDLYHYHFNRHLEGIVGCPTADFDIIPA